MTREIYYDPYDRTLDADPHPMWRRMRDEMPLYRNDKYGFWAVSRYEDVHRMSVDWRTFSSAKGSVLEMIDLPAEVFAQFKNMLFEDPPDHDLHRQILARTFLPRRITALEAEIREMCRGFLADLDPNGFDLVRDYGSKIPMMVIGMLLGVPVEDRPYLQHLADATIHREEGNETDMGLDNQMKQLEYFAGLASRRRSEPTDDIVTDLVQAEVDDGAGGTRHLDDGEMVAYMSLVSAAGNETVTNLLGWAGLSLYQNPDQRQILLDDPSIIPNAVEEFLRFEAPSPIQARLVMEDVELYGQKVEAGSKMALITGSAGRDDRQYENPDRLDVRRKIGGHVSFGHGIHFCLGAALARLEAKVALEELLVRFPAWEIDEANSEMVHTSTVRGWANLKASAV